MKTTSSVKLDKDVKEQAAALASELGLTLSSVINATLTQFVKERRLHVAAHPEFNETTKKELRAALQDIKEGKDLSGTFNDISDMRAHLLS